MIRRPPGSTRTDTLFPYTTLFRSYNKVDCENTEGLRNWLVTLRPANLPWRMIGPTVAVTDEKAEARSEAEMLAQRLITAINKGGLPTQDESRTLVGRSDERGRGKGWVSTCRARGATSRYNKSEHKNKENS